MNYPDLVESLTLRTAMDPDQADAVTQATVAELAHQVPTSEMRDLLVQLPGPLYEIPPADPDGVRHMPLDEFCMRVSQRAQLGDTDRARAYVHSVFAVLGQAADAEQLRSAIAQLRPEYQALLPPETDATGEFLTRVQRRGGLQTRQAAVTSTHAVLAALAQRLSEGQAHELAAKLPAELRPYLTSAQGDAQPFNKPGFLGTVGDQAGLGAHESAETHARAVLGTIHDTAPEGEISDTLAQLPPELADMFA